MENSQGSHSEVARLLQQIRQEYVSAQQGMSGLAYGTAKHVFITQKMENMGILQQELEVIVGADTSIALIAAQLSAVPETKSSSVQ